jgi:hypothetical protein
MVACTAAAPELDHEFTRLLCAHLKRRSDGRPKPKPTRLPPGPEKVAILCERLQSGQQLWHELDGPRDDHEGIVQERHGNGPCKSRRVQRPC